jgi:hypothetical protein
MNQHFFKKKRTNICVEKMLDPTFFKKKLLTNIFWKYFNIFPLPPLPPTSAVGEGGGASQPRNHG